MNFVYYSTSTEESPIIVFLFVDVHLIFIWVPHTEVICNCRNLQITFHWAHSPNVLHWISLQKDQSASSATKQENQYKLCHASTVPIKVLPARRKMHFYLSFYLKLRKLPYWFGHSLAQIPINNCYTKYSGGKHLPLTHHPLSHAWWVMTKLSIVARPCRQVPLSCNPMFPTSPKILLPMLLPTWQLHGLSVEDGLGRANQRGSGGRKLPKQELMSIIVLGKNKSHLKSFRIPEQLH